MQWQISSTRHKIGRIKREAAEEKRDEKKRMEKNEKKGE